MPADITALDSDGSAHTPALEPAYLNADETNGTAHGTAHEETNRPADSSAHEAAF